MTNSQTLFVLHPPHGKTRQAVPSVLKSLKEMPTLKVIVYTDTFCTPEESSVRITDPSFKGQLLSFAEMVELGRANPTPPTKPKPESVAVIMYTSGSTGDPKGVIVKQAHLLAIVAAVKVQMGSVLVDGSVYLGYLPLAHILEMAAEFT
jgi:long-chain acyl-CoA synthetase